jgi:hypothetical protein
VQLGETLFGPDVVHTLEQCNVSYILAKRSPCHRSAFATTELVGNYKQHIYQIRLHKKMRRVGSYARFGI